MSKPIAMNTISILDDDENLSWMCERRLYYAGCVTPSVSSSVEALQFMNKNTHVHAIILDVRVSPQVDSIRVLARRPVKNISEEERRVW